MFWYRRFRWRLRAAHAVRAQVRSGVLPEVRDTFTRLRAAGLTERQAYRFLAAACEAEMTAMVLEDRVWDRSALLQSGNTHDVLPARTSALLIRNSLTQLRCGKLPVQHGPQLALHDE